ncbi:uncharacterized protein [Antedon mediterranea]|uniref:uncharacterized protein n=1 Tax=Antedon mediterranea TaxID=105859 RepID=UPI003AF9E84B
MFPKVLYLHSVKEQLRFFAYDEEDNEFSIPINSEIGFETADIEEGSSTLYVKPSVLLHKDLELPLKVKVNSNQHARLPDLMLEGKNLTIKQKILMKYLIGTCISEDAVKKKLIECIPTECSNLSLQVPLMIGDGTDDRLTLFEEHVQDVVHSVIDEKIFNSYQGNQDIIINSQQNLKIEEITHGPHVSTVKTNQAKVKKKGLPLKNKRVKIIKKKPDGHSSNSPGKRYAKKCTPQASNITGDTDHTYEKEIYLKKDRPGSITYDRNDVDSYEEADECSFKDINDDYEVVNEGSLKDNDYDYEEFDEDTFKDNDYYEEVTYISKDVSGITADEEGNINSYKVGNDYEKRIYLQTEIIEDSYKDADDDYDKFDYQQFDKETEISKKENTTPEEHRIKGKQDLPDNLSDMTCNQVQDCLKLLKLDKHVKDFQEIGIDGNLLMSLDQNIMKTELNLTNIEILKLEMLITKKWLPNI